MSGGRVSRRDFVRGVAGALASAGLLPACARGAAYAADRQAADPRSGTLARKLGPIGVQLYSVRGLLDRDVEGTLAALAEIGYREVEFAGLHGKSAKEVRAMLDRHGLVSPSSHIALEDLTGSWPRVLDEIGTLGNRFVVCAWIDDKYRTVDGYTRVAGMFDTVGAAARKAGIQFAYHNHAYEFAPVDGRLPYDILLANADRDLVRMELDLYWITKGGGDPLAYFARFPGRFPLVHVKDMAKGGAMADVGQGIIDWKAIFAHAEQAGIAHYFVEHDDPPSPLQDMKASYTYLRALRY